MSEIKRLGGAPALTGPLKILDKNTKQEESPDIEIRLHEEVFTEDEKTRKERKEGDPEVRIRHIESGRVPNYDD